MPEIKPKKTTAKKKTVAKKATAVKSVKKSTSTKRKTSATKTTKRATATKRKTVKKSAPKKSTAAVDENFVKQYPIMGAQNITRSNKPIEGSASQQRRSFKPKSDWHKRHYHPLGKHPHLPHHHSFSIIIVISLLAAAAFFYFGLRPTFDFTIPEVKMQREYQSEKYNFKLERPAKWQVSEFVVGEGQERLESVVLQNGAQSIVIYTTREVNEETLVPGSSYADEVNGNQVVRYRDYDPDTGLLLERVVIERPDGLVHELRGYGPLFERVVDSFTLEAN